MRDEEGLIRKIEMKDAEIKKAMKEEIKKEIKEAMLCELENWWEDVDFNFVVENLIEKEVFDETNLDDSSAYDEIYEILSEAIRESFRVRF